MILEIKQRGDSKVIILPKDLLKYHDLKVGDFVDIADMVKAEVLI